jgi:adenylate cyclase
MIERERRFLVATLPMATAELPEPDHIVQGYLATGRVTVRVRRIGGSHILSVKVGSSRNRVEIERSLDPDEFDALWNEAHERRIDKQRHRVALDDGLVAELDLFAGDLAGRRIVEVEFPDDPTADTFEPPAWFGREVTDDTRYTNASLARHGWPDD